MQERKSNNSLKISGEVLDEFSYSHSVCGEEFYSFTLGCKRLSGYVDKLICLAKRQLLNDAGIREGSSVVVVGNFRSHNNISNFGTRLQLNVLVHTIEEIELQQVEINEISLTGFICKPPNNRLTPFGREITDILLAVNRQFNRTDYIPCIFWGKNAKLACKLEVGEKIELAGRVQSREYEKMTQEGEYTVRVTYEVSVNKFNLVDNNNNAI